MLTIKELQTLIQYKRYNNCAAKTRGMGFSILYYIIMFCSSIVKYSVFMLYWTKNWLQTTEWYKHLILASYKNWETY